MLDLDPISFIDDDLTLFSSYQKPLAYFFFFKAFHNLFPRQIRGKGRGSLPPAYNTCTINKIHFFYQSCMHTKNKYHTYHYHSSSKLLYSFKQSMVSLVYHEHFMCGFLLGQRSSIPYHIMVTKKGTCHNSHFSCLAVDETKCKTACKKYVNLTVS